MDLYHTIRNQYNGQKTLFISIFWGTTAGVLSMGMNFVINILAARILGTDLGALTLFISATNTLLTFGLIGLNPMATVFVARAKSTPEKLPALISNIYGIALYSSLIWAIIALCLNLVPGNPVRFWHTDTSITVFFAFLWFIFSALEIVQVVILNGFSAFRSLALFSLIRAIISLAVMFTFLKTWGVSGGVAGYAVSAMTGTFLISWFLRKRCHQESFRLSVIPAVDISTIRKLVSESFPIFLASLFMAPAIWISNYIVFDRAGGSEALSIFAVTNQWMIVIQFLPIQISKVLLPRLSSSHGTGAYRSVLSKGIMLSMGIALTMIILSFIFERQIIDLFHFNYLKTSIPLRIMLVVSLVATFNSFYGQSILSEGKAWIRPLSDSATALSLITATLFMTRYDLLTALPVASVVSYSAGVVVLVILSRFKR